ncbi:MAG: PQQ-like beta-propeller repeat protein [Fuerstiella sp.]|nr:PQQ-like beta-propeller repeat protein [Fuerstiella sp.]
MDPSMLPCMFLRLNYFWGPLLLLAVQTIPVSADDWPQWNGPTRDGVLHESGMIARIPDGGLQKLWEQPINLGYSGPAVANGRVYVTDYVKTSGSVTNNPGSRDHLKGTERILCFDAVQGTPVWEHKYDRPYAVSYGSGPRVTPTIHDELVYSLGAEGNLICLRADSGKVVWDSDFALDYNAETPHWGHSAAPLIYRETVICLVGGDGSLVVAFDRSTGREKWRSLSASAIGYCSPTVVRAGGTDQLLIWDPSALHSLNPTTGHEYWNHPLKPGFGMSILPPIHEGNLLYASGVGGVSAMFRLATDRPEAEVLWRGNPRSSIYLATAGAIFDNGYLYGTDTRSGALVCARASDGKRIWQTARPTSGEDGPQGKSNASAFLTKTEHGYLIFGDTGDLISATLDPHGYTETGRFHAIDPLEVIGNRKVVWTFPAVSDGRLYLRNGQSVVCYSLKDNS